MPGALILFASREGQTEKVAIRVSARLEAAGVAVSRLNAADAVAIRHLDLDDFDLLVFGASMHASGLERELTRFIRENCDRIDQKPKSFFLVLLSAATKDPELKTEFLTDAQAKMKEQLVVEFGDTEMIAGALRYSKYSIPVKWLMRRIAVKMGEGADVSRDYEYTDWQQVDNYADRLMTLV